MGIIISGWYGNGNVGDEVILQAMIDNFTHQWNVDNITVLSYNPQYTKELQHVGAVYQVPIGVKSFLRHFFTGHLVKTLKAIYSCDVFILGGGGFLSDWQPEAPKGWLKQLRIAKFFDKKTFLYKVGVGPFNTEKGRRLAKFYIEKYADEIIVRDKYSYDVLVQDVGIDQNRVSIEIDPVANMNLSEYVIQDDGYVSLIYTKYFDKDIFGDQRYKWPLLLNCYKAQIQTLLNSNLNVRVVLFQPNTEEDLKMELIKSFGNKIEIEVPCNFREAIILIAKSKATISFRLHGNIISYALNKPFMPIIYHQKTKGFLDLIKYKASEVIIEVGDGYNWKAGNLNEEEWVNKTNEFISLLGLGKIKVFYEKQT